MNRLLYIIFVLVIGIFVIPMIQPKFGNAVFFLSLAGWMFFIVKFMPKKA